MKTTLKLTVKVVAFDSKVSRTRTRTGLFKLFCPATVSGLPSGDTLWVVGLSETKEGALSTFQEGLKILEASKEISVEEFKSGDATSYTLINKRTVKTAAEIDLSGDWDEGPALRAPESL